MFAVIKQHLTFDGDDAFTVDCVTISINILHSVAQM